MAKVKNTGSCILHVGKVVCPPHTTVDIDNKELEKFGATAPGKHYLENVLEVSDYEGKAAPKKGAKKAKAAPKKGAKKAKAVAEKAKEDAELAELEAELKGK